EIAAKFSVMFGTMYVAKCQNEEYATLFWGASDSFYTTKSPTKGSVISHHTD
ncbi:hypothetical protein GIB67_025484, partial [Kingdonia uniflora]